MAEFEDRIEIIDGVRCVVPYVVSPPAKPGTQEISESALRTIAWRWRDDDDQAS